MELDEQVAVVDEASDLKHELHVVAELSPVTPGSGARNVRVYPAVRLPRTRTDEPPRLPG